MCSCGVSLLVSVSGLGRLCCNVARWCLPVSVSVSCVLSVVLPYGRLRHAVLPQGRTTDRMSGGVCVDQTILLSKHPWGQRSGLGFCCTAYDLMCVCAVFITLCCTCTVCISWNFTYVLLFSAGFVSVPHVIVSFFTKQIGKKQLFFNERVGLDSEGHAASPANIDINRPYCVLKASQDAPHEVDWQYVVCRAACGLFNSFMLF